MLPVGFVCTVFFQIEQLYALCHVIALILYLFAIIGSAICIKQRQNREIIDFMLLIVFNNFIFVIITNLVYMGLQRYLIYSFGIFYIALYLVVRELVKMSKFERIKKILHV